MPREEPVLYCICRSTDGERFMVCCDSCDQWFHGDWYILATNIKLMNYEIVWISPKSKANFSRIIIVPTAVKRRVWNRYGSIHAHNARNPRLLVVSTAQISAESKWRGSDCV